MDHIAAHRLDGNAAAGRLEDVFAVEITSVRATCDGCGATAAVAELTVYPDAPGMIARCPSCESVVIRLAQVPGSTWIDLRGARTLQIPID